MRTAIVLVVLLASNSAFAKLSFHIPEGWLDLSPGAPAKNFEGIPPAMLAQARQSATKAFAVDLKGASAGFAPNFNARVLPCPGPITNKVLDGMAAGLSKAIAKSSPGAQISIKERKIVELNGVSCARVRNRITVQGITAHQLMWIIPGGAQCGVLTYSASASQFPKYEAIFDKAARATSGIKAPKSRGGFWSRVMGGGFRGAIIGGIAGAIAAVFMGMQKKKKKAQEQQPPAEE